MTTLTESRPSLTNTGLATLLFLASESVFFLTLILSFFYLRAEAVPVRLTGGDLLDPLRTGMFTLALIASSGTYMLAERNHRRGNRRGLQLWLAVTVVLGIVFLFGQAEEYRGLWGQGMTIRSDVFGTQFYTLTGIHFLHVTAGVVMLSILTFLAMRGRSGEPSVGAIQPIGFYWHFVDVVWIILFTVVYVIGA